MEVERFIPTPVGNTSGRSSRPAGISVHPHARGEHRFKAITQFATDGSSPRPWGTLRCLLCHGSRLRFIPTPVGNTVWCGYNIPRCAVHPHARGEHSSCGSCVWRGDGSSPRPWGTPLIASPHKLFDRFIPTPVGNTPAPLSPGLRFAVHPHARGEHTTLEPEATLSIGSSPRPWGTRHRRRRRVLVYRFIPTPVGNTYDDSSIPCTTSVHPHARGEHMLKFVAFQSRVGSSPRPWGTHRGCIACLTADRFIPTPVGNTFQSLT